MKRAIIYARVSTKEQNVDMQISDLRTYAQARGLQVVSEYIDTASGSRNDRENYIKLFDDVRKRKCDAVLVWRFDRFARSTKELINGLEEFRALNVDFISYKEAVDTSTPTGKILFTLISCFAEFEREILKMRVIAGIEKAKAKGVKLGRPKLPNFTIKEVLELRAKKVGYKAICDKVGISKSAYYEIIKAREA